MSPQRNREADVVVVGLGPGGEAAATELAGAGLRVVAVDRRLVGGECPYYACVPTKMAVRAADALGEARRVGGLAGAADVTPDWSPVAARIRQEATDDWDDRVAVERLEKAGVEFVRGHGRLAGPRVVEVDEHRITARRGVLLDTGTEPSVPPVDGLAGTPYWTNREAVRADRLPETLLVLGGGPVGVELAQVFARFGVEVTLLEVADRILAPEEPEASQVVTEALGRDGVRMLTGVRVDAVEHADSGFTVRAGEQVVHGERLLVATGRRPNLADIGLETVGLDPEAPSIEVDGHLRAADGLWAIGDITGKGAFTHVSMYQSGIAVQDILGRDGTSARYHAVPRVTFSDPEVGAVGMTERQAREDGLAVRVGTTDLGSSARGWIGRAEGLVKLVEDADRGVLVGATSVGPSGGEVLSMLATAVHAEVRTATLASMIYAYPTFHRAVEDALKRLR
ncbi:MAG TPA: NAD(P)/FAD-dependent oxidoreductase [Nocardioidaceae bacterium]|jgi:pyruvate/2-oxoglutarate dehydrogenase complex dihydrolipoamide dehydrogenase (E3) component